MNSNIRLQDFAFYLKIDFISLLQPSAAVIKSNEAHESNRVPPPIQELRKLLVL